MLNRTMGDALPSSKTRQTPPTMYTIDTFADANLEEVLEQLTVDEKLSLLAVSFSFKLACKYTKAKISVAI